MRLIDAERLVRDINDLPYGYRGMVKTIIYNQPTVEAIPIDWISKNADIFFYGIERLRLMDMINKWKQENNSI